MCFVFKCKLMHWSLKLFIRMLISCFNVLFQKLLLLILFIIIFFLLLLLLLIQLLLLIFEK